MPLVARVQQVILARGDELVDRLFCSESALLRVGVVAQGVVNFAIAAKQTHRVGRSVSAPLCAASTNTQGAEQEIVSRLFDESPCGLLLVKVDFVVLVSVSFVQPSDLAASEHKNSNSDRPNRQSKEHAQKVARLLVKWQIVLLALEVLLYDTGLGVLVAVARGAHLVVIAV